ncbi:MAG: hypothetical protein N7Q72_06320 [Spiroplasma sp. Tabriz.8]|nr:hypothetical protein [Spiroplasma sp. Tabriz.8]
MLFSFTEAKEKYLHPNIYIYIYIYIYIFIKNGMKGKLQKEWNEDN